MADAASVMGEVMTEFSGGGGDVPVSPAPTPEAPAAPLAQPTAGESSGENPSSVGSQPDLDTNWYEQLLQQEQTPDPLTGLVLDDAGWQQIAQDPAQFGTWAQNARQQLAAIAEQRKAEAELEPDFEWVGGKKNAGVAARVFGDLLRGDYPLTPEEARESSAPTYVERGLEQIRRMDEPTAWRIAAGVLNQMPEIIDHNRDYVLERLGLDPNLVDAYKQVTLAGGYQMPEDTEAESAFLAQVPASLHDAFKKLPPAVKKDLQQRDIGVAKFDLEQYARNQQWEAEQAKQAEMRAQQQAAQVEEKAQVSLADSTRQVFQEYIDRGKSLGLDPLQAAGAAALAYADLEQSYWQANSEYRRTMDDWYGRLKSGNELQIQQTRSAYKKMFEQAYRKALQANAPKRPTGVPPMSGPRPIAPAPQQQPAQFVAPLPPNGGGATDPVDLMNEILRQHGAIR